MAAPSVASIMRDHVALALTSFDRLYLGGYVPVLQTPRQLATFCHERLRAPILSPALFGPLRERFDHAVATLAAEHHVPVIHCRRGQRKDEVTAWHRARFHEAEGVVVIGIAQEKASAFKARKIVGDQGHVAFAFSRQAVAVNHVYFYVQDREWGPAFVKVGTYLPYPVRVCLNAHDWAKQQLRRQGIACAPLDNGFRWCAEPERLQQVCNALGSSNYLHPARRGSDGTRAGRRRA